MSIELSWESIATGLYVSVQMGSVRFTNYFCTCEIHKNAVCRMQFPEYVLRVCLPPRYPHNGLLLLTLPQPWGQSLISVRVGDCNYSVGLPNHTETSISARFHIAGHHSPPATQNAWKRLAWILLCFEPRPPPAMWPPQRRWPSIS